MKIIRALLVALVLLVTWSLIAGLVSEEIDTAQTIWGSNLISAQDYLYGKVDNADMVMVGSSLTESLLFKRVAGRRVHNLGLAGQGVFDGLKLVAKRGVLPALVCIETNIVMQAESAEFHQVLSNPLANVIRCAIPALRQRYQPVGVIKGLLWGRKAPRSKENNLLEDRPVNEMSLQRKREDYADSIPPEALQLVLKSLRVQVDELRARGVRVLFFEAPVHPVLCSAPKAVSIRQGFTKVFPESDFDYIAQPPCGEYQTTDGHHLGELSQTRYSAWLRTEIARLLSAS